jgi:SAM-dependent methyltransferase
VFKEFEEVEYLNNCVICGSKYFVEHKKASRFLNLKKPFRVVHCRTCDLLWLNPRPTIAGYKKLYSGDFYFTKSNEIPGNYEEYVLKRIPHFAYRVRRLKNIFLNGEIKLLDIGSATGEFVDISRRNGIKAVGLDVSAHVVKKAIRNYGNYFYQGDLDSFPSDLENLKFDVVHLNHTFEHFLEPTSSLKKMRDLLEDDGILIIEVPYQFSNIIEKFKSFIGRERPKRFDLFSLHHPFFILQDLFRDYLKNTTSIYSH